MSEIIETAVSWDHDTGEVTVDTRRRSIATRLRKLGFAVTYDKDSGYYQLRTKDHELGISFFRRRKKKL